MPHTRHLRRSQQGIATISMVVVFLLVMTLITIYANRRAIADLQTLRNQKEYDLAFTQADIGLATFPVAIGNGMEFLAGCFTNSQSCTKDISTLQEPFNKTLRADLKNAFEITRCSTTSTQDSCLNVISRSEYKVNSTQSTPDARAQIHQTFIYRQRLAGQPSAAVMARQLVTTGGSATIVNDNPKTAGLTVHSGGDVNLGNATLKSLPGTPPLASVAKKDTNIKDKTPDEFFEALFGENKSSVRNDPLTCKIKCTGGGTACTQTESCQQAPLPATQPTTYLNALSTKKGKTILITEPELTINSNVTIGSPTEPVILIVDGNLKLSGGAVIHGLVYATGGVDTQGAGNATIYGSLITEGTCCGLGNPTVIYSGGMNEAIGVSTGGYIPIPGSWRDF